MSEAVHPGLALERFRNYLLLLAQLQWDHQLRAWGDPSDLVQKTLLEAHKNQADYKGTSDAELKGWLHKILEHNLLDALKWLARDKRDVKRQRPLAEDLEDSSARIQALAAEQSSPSKQAVKNEQLIRLADSLERLLPDQREAVMLHHLQGLPIGEVARRMECTYAAAAGLLRRGLEALRELMGDQE
jgi:RNA polymerase sigma-70 factor (ECF subfamily)